MSMIIWKYVPNYFEQNKNHIKMSKSIKYKYVNMYVKEIFVLIRHSL